MSDEQSPPPPALRLKPRLRPPPAAAGGVGPASPGASVPPPAPPVSLVTPPSAGSEPPQADASSAEYPPTPAPQKIRFKPRLSSEPTSAATVVPNAVQENTIPTIPPSPPAPPPGAAIPPATIPVSSATTTSGPAVPARASSPGPTIAGKPLLFAEPGAPSEAAPVVVPGKTAPAPVHYDSPSAAVTADAGGFKLKPKAPAPPPALFIGDVPRSPTSAAPPAPGAMPPASPALPPPVSAAKAPPPFPVVAPPTVGKPVAQIPHINVTGEAPDSPKKALAGARPVRRALVGLAAVLVLGGGGYFAYDTYLETSTPPAPAPKAKPTTASPAPAAAAPKAAGGPTPSETLNQIAHAPANAINKAQDAIAARRASGQTRVDLIAAGEDVPDKPAAVAPRRVPKPATPAAKATGMRTIAPGIAASSEVEATSDASSEFRSFVTTAKISSVVWGATPARAFINGRLMRAGDTADAALGIKFEGVNVERRQLIFKDRSGATVARRY